MGQAQFRAQFFGIREKLVQPLHYAQERYGKAPARHTGKLPGKGAGDFFQNCLFLPGILTHGPGDKCSDPPVRLQHGMEKGFLRHLS